MESNDRSRPVLAKLTDRSVGAAAVEEVGKSLAAMVELPERLPRRLLVCLVLGSSLSDDADTPCTVDESRKMAPSRRIVFTIAVVALYCDCVYF